MTLPGIEALAFDTGGTVLDWHSGIGSVLAETGARRRTASRATGLPSPTTIAAVRCNA